MSTPATKRCDATKITTGTRLSRVSYVEVVSLQGNRATVKNEEGFQWDIDLGIIEREMFAADQFTDEKQVSLTEAVEALESAGDSIFTVVFTKQPVQKDISDALANLSATDMAKKTARDKIARGFLTGQERRLVGYLASTEPKLGRSTVVDLESSAGTPLRLVDHRTIKELILRNTRYIVK